MMVRPFLANSFSNVFHDTILHDVPATIILPESWFLSCKVNAVEMSLCISDQSLSLCGQVAADKPIKAVSVLVKHQHMNNGYGKDKIKRFFQSGG